MNHQTAETQLEFALRAQQTEKELARFHLSRLIKAINNCPNHAKFFVTGTPEFEAADAYLNPPVVKKLYANDEEVREELHKNLRPSSSMVEPPAHNGKDAGSSPAAATNEGEQS